MKKLAITSAIIATLALTACAKPVTTVEAGSSVLNIPTQQVDSSKQILDDVKLIQSVGMNQQDAAVSLQQRMEAAMQKQDKAEMAKLAVEFKSFVTSANQKFSQLDLKTEDGKALRDAVINNSNIGLEVSQVILNKTEAEVDPQQMQALQEKAMAAQEKLMQISETIHAKVQGVHP
ncbi:hypothetical protein [Acinetobacter sp. c3-l95]|uniref:hypothetical protein n=1 Tax=Acinetobacter sp. c3-l95 TaxID=3342804 RepID=UPI0035B7D4B5